MSKVNPVYQYGGYRIVDDDGTEANASSLSLNSAYSIGVTTTVRVRLLIQETAGGAANNQGFVWQYSLNDGTWTNITTTSSVARAVSSQLVDDADTTSSSSNRIGSGTFITDNNGQCEDGVTTGASCDFAGNDETEVELSLQLVSGDVANNDSVKIRALVESDVPSGTPAELTAVVALPDLEATPGSFSLSGVDPDVTAHYRLAAETGSFSQAGVDAALAKDFKLAAETGSFAITGVDPDITGTFLLAAEAGSFSTSGQNAVIYTPWLADADHFTVDENTAGQHTADGWHYHEGAGGAFTLSAQTGSFSLSGVDPDVTADFLLEASVGSFTLTGQDATLSFTTDMPVNTGVFSLTGVDAALKAANIVTVDDFGGFGTGKFDTVFAGLVWSNDANAVDGSTSTYAFTTSESSSQRLILDDNSVGIDTRFVSSVVQKTRVRVYGSITGTGTPRLEIKVLWLASSELLGIIEITSGTPGWSDWITLEAPGGGWGGVAGLSDGLRLVIKAYDDTGTLTEARVYSTETETTSSESAYVVAFNRPAFQRGLVMQAEAGSFSLAGVDANFNTGNLTALEAGTFSLTGQDIDFQRGYVMPAEAGTFALAGVDVAFQSTGDMPANTGVFAVSGVDAAITVNRKLLAEARAFAISGVDPDISRTALLQAESGSFAVSGVDAAITADYAMDAEAGTFTLTGESVNLNYLLGDMPANTGVFALAGQDVAFARGYGISAETGTFALSGQIAYLGYNRNRRIYIVT